MKKAGTIIKLVLLGGFCLVVLWVAGSIATFVAPLNLPDIGLGGKKGQAETAVVDVNQDGVHDANVRQADVNLTVDIPLTIRDETPLVEAQAKEIELMAEVKAEAERKVLLAEAALEEAKFKAAEEGADELAKLEIERAKAELKVAKEELEAANKNLIAEQNAASQNKIDVDEATAGAVVAEQNKIAEVHDTDAGNYDALAAATLQSTIQTMMATAFLKSSLAYAGGGAAFALVVVGCAIAWRRWQRAKIRDKRERQAPQLTEGDDGWAVVQLLDDEGNIRTDLIPTLLHRGNPVGALTPSDEPGESLLMSGIENLGERALMAMFGGMAYVKQLAAEAGQVPFDRLTEIATSALNRPRKQVDRRRQQITIRHADKVGAGDETTVVNSKPPAKSK
jgi:hypothetical protein